MRNTVREDGAAALPCPMCGEPSSPIMNGQQYDLWRCENGHNWERFAEPFNPVPVLSWRGIAAVGLSLAIFAFLMFRVIR